MPLMDWGSALDVGVKAMNDEHKVLLTYMNELYDQNAKKVAKAQILATLKKLGEYTTKHFNDEEQYMKGIEFPDFEIHSAIHKDLLKKFGEHLHAFETGSEAFLPDRFFAFLKVWLTAHIQGIDSKYGKHAHAKGRAS